MNDNGLILLQSLMDNSDGTFKIYYQIEGGYSNWVIESKGFKYFLNERLSFEELLKATIVLSARIGIKEGWISKE